MEFLEWFWDEIGDFIIGILALVFLVVLFTFPAIIVNLTGVSWWVLLYIIHLFGIIFYQYEKRKS